MSIERRNFPQFFITAAGPCPYLPGKMERKVFTHLVGPDAKNAEFTTLARWLQAQSEHCLSSGLRWLQFLCFSPGASARV